MTMDLKPYLSRPYATSPDQMDAGCYTETIPGYPYHSFNHHPHLSHAYPGAQSSSWTPEYQYTYSSHTYPAATVDWEEYRNCYPPSSVSPESSSSPGRAYPESGDQVNSMAATAILYEERDQQTTYQDLRHQSSPRSTALRYHDAAELSVREDKVSASFMSSKRKTCPTASNGKKERRRTISLNSAFSNLRSRIPRVPPDTKLSKIKTLRLASLYIQHLNRILTDPLDGPQMQPNDFEVDLHQFKRQKSPRGAALVSASEAAASTGLLPLPSPSASTTSSSTTSSESSELKMKGCYKAVDGTTLERKTASGHHSHPTGKGRTGWSEAVWKEQVRSGPASTLIRQTSYPMPNYASSSNSSSSCHQQHPNQSLSAYN